MGAPASQGRPVDQEGEIFANLTLVDDEVERTLPEHSPPHYQRPLSEWILASWDADNAQVIFPIVEPLSGRERWLCLTLWATPSRDTRLFSLSDVSARFYQERLAARNTSLMGMRHDLANQTFLLKALPELAEFASPSELIEDLLEGVPLLLDFLDQRLGSAWTSSLQREPARSAQEVIERLNAWAKANALLSSDRWVISCAPELAETTGDFTTLGVCWSITLLVRRLHSHQLVGAPSKAHARLTLNSAPALSTPIVGLCGQLLHDRPRFELAITVDGWDLDQIVQGWRLGEHIRGDRSDVRAHNVSPKELSAAWFGSWVSAAHFTGGVVLRRGDALLITC